MKMKSFTEFINEENSIQKARKKLLKANQKVDKFDKKGRAAAEEIELRKNQVDYEQEKARTKREIETASDNTSKGMAKDKLKKIKKDWKSEKKQLKDRIKNLRK